MSSLTPTVSPLRKRMIDDMQMRNFAGKTQVHYIRAVRRLAAFLKRSPDTATAEELRAFQLHTTDTGTAPPTINATSDTRLTKHLRHRPSGEGTSELLPTPNSLPKWRFLAARCTVAPDCTARCVRGSIPQTFATAAQARATIL